MFRKQVVIILCNFFWNKTFSQLQKLLSRYFLFQRCYGLNCAPLPIPNVKSNDQCLNIFILFRNRFTKLRWGHTGVWCAPNPTWLVFVWEDGHGETDTHREKAMWWWNRLEWWIYKSRSSMTASKPSEVRKKWGRIPLQIAEGAWPCLHLDFRALASKIVSTKVLLFIDTQFVVLGHSSPTKLIQVGNGHIQSATQLSEYHLPTYLLLSQQLLSLNHRSNFCKHLQNSDLYHC